MASDMAQTNQTWPAEARTIRANQRVLRPVTGRRGGSRRDRPPPVDRLDQERQLRRRQHHRAVDDRRPDELSPLQPLGEQAQARAVPVQAFQVVGACLAEEEQMAAKTDRLPSICATCAASPSNP